MTIDPNDPNRPEDWDNPADVGAGPASEPPGTAAGDAIEEQSEEEQSGQEGKPSLPLPPD